MHCKQNTSLTDDLFVPFISEIKNNHKIAKGIRNRKAFWSHLKYKPGNNPITDYEGAVAFVTQFHENWDKLNNNKLDALFSDFGIINGFELFQRCMIKKFVSGINN